MAGFMEAKAKEGRDWESVVVMEPVAERGPEGARELVNEA